MLHRPNLWNFLCYVDRASLYNLFQMKPTGLTLLLGIFISTSVHVSGNYVPIIRRTYCLCATLVWVAVRKTPDSEKFQRRIHTEISPDDGHIVA